jgi:hypothetical protein
MITTMSKTTPPGIARLAPSIPPPFAPFQQNMATGQPQPKPIEGRVLLLIGYQSVSGVSC